MMNQNLPMQDKEMIGDALSSQKLITNVYSTFANECAQKGLREDMLNILHEEHEIEADLFCEMNSRGWYQTQPAEQQKVQQTKQKFQSVTF